MPQGTTRSQITFEAPFSLAEIDEIQPLGTYDIDIEEEIVKGNERCCGSGVRGENRSDLRLQSPGRRPI